MTENLLNSLLRKPLFDLGFTEAEALVFKREISAEVRQLLLFPTRTHLNNLVFSVNGSVRFEKMEEMLGNGDPLSGTFLVPIHWLRKKKDFFEWSLDQSSVGNSVAPALAECSELLLPFLNKMSRIEALESQLTYEIGAVPAQDSTVSSDSERVKRSLGKGFRLVSASQTIEKLAAVYYVEGKVDSAKHLIDSELFRLRATTPRQPIAERTCIRLERLRKMFL